MKKIKKQYLVDLLFVLAGSFTLALSINLLLKPNELVAGGANGVSIILEKLFGWPLAASLYAMNIPLLILCFWLLGREVGMKTILGSMIYPFFVGITAGLPALTMNPLLASVFGGVITGLGLGLVFKGHASTGGTAIISQIVHKYAKIPLGTAVMFVDGLIILTAFFVFPADKVLYALICLFIIGRVIDLVQVSFNLSKNVLIISNKSPEVAKMIMATMDRGVTRIPITGGFNESEQHMLMCVLPEADFALLKENVLEIDPNSFVVAMSASEVMGRGFSLGR